MEPNSKNANDAFKRTPQQNSFDNGCSSQDGSFSNKASEWYETKRDHDKNRDETFNDKGREKFQEENRERLNEETPHQPIQQPIPFPAYGYNTTDHSNIDSSRRAMTMMSYNLLAAMNNMQSGVNPMDGMTMTPNNMPVNRSSAPLPMATGMEMTQTTNSAMNPYAYMGMSGDNMFGMMGMGNYCHYGMMSGQENVMVGTIKEVVHLNLSVLYPPKPTDPAPISHGRPPGCKTVFVGGLPGKATEEIIREVFERCGEILTIRMSKNFCHIRFASEAFVKHAMYFSGYRMKIENKDDQPYTGRLHVDYARAGDDEFEYKCQQRAIQHEARCKQQQEQDYYKVPTPPPVLHYSDHEATVLGEKLQSEDTFQQAVFILVTWLERGECSKRNASSFYSMIQSTNSHVRRLMNEKLKYEDELNKARLMLKKQMQDILLQFNEIEKVFNTASLQKVWDHFTKAQRENIERWKKQTEEIKNAHVEEVLNDRIEDQIDLSGDEEEKDEGAAKTTQDTSDPKNELEEELTKLKDENDALHCQLKAAENETMVLRSETAQALEFKERHIQCLMQAIQNSTMTLNQKRAVDETELKELCAFKSRRSTNKDYQHGNDHFEIDNMDPVSTTTSVMNISESEARLIGLISIFLHVHPIGANIDYICSYLHQIDSTIQSRDVESLMKRFPTIYREDSTGIGASLRKKWRFLGFYF